MESIRIRNLRSLEETGEIELKPLTILVGKNSSGKSTFLRFFPLMKQTLETKTNEPILWYSSNNVDFGSFKESVNSNSKDSMIFDFNFSLTKRAFYESAYYHSRRFSRYYYIRINRELGILNSPLNFKVSIECKEKFIEKINICFEENDIEIIFKNKDKISKLRINDQVYDSNVFLVDNLRSTANNFFPRITYKTSEKVLPSEDDYFGDQLLEKFKTMAYSTTKEDTLNHFIDTIEPGTSEYIYKFLQSENNAPKKLKEKLSHLEIDDLNFSEIKNLIIGRNLNNILSACNDYLNKSFLNVRYIAPIRASAERFYRIQGLSVDEIDPQGENIPMILYNMSEKDRSEFSNWTSEQFEFEVSTRLEGGHVSLRIKYQASSEEINLADTGFGYSQILPIILLLWRAVKNKSDQSSTIVIEQPELHLHPSLQARLIDTFVKIIILSKKSKVDLKIIFETHSETMINRIGYLLAKKIEGLKKEYINVIIFDKIEAYRSEINITSYTDEGFLKSWPIGFFSPEDL